MYPEVTRINDPHEYYMDLTDKLRELKNQLIEMHKNKTDKPKQLVKRVNETRKTKWN